MRPRAARKPRLCIVAPCYNEEAAIESFHDAVRSLGRRLPDLDLGFIYVDDGSSDGTLHKLNAIAARDSRVEVYSLSRNFGHQVALRAGLENARADAIVLMDSDLQHPPELIPDMVALWKKGHDIVSAIREDTAGASLFKRFSSWLFYRVLNLISTVRVPDGAADFVLLSRRAQEALKDMPERHLFLRGMISWIGYPRAFIRYRANERRFGVSKYTLRKMVALSLDAIFSFSSMPMQIASRSGVGLALAGFLYFGYVLSRYFLVGDTVKGWSSLIAVVLVLGGIQILFIGLIGQYLARVFDQVKGRPLYLLKQRPRSQVAQKGKRYGNLEQSRSAA